MFMLLVFESLVQHCEGPLALCKAFAMPLSFGLGHFGLLSLERLGLLGDALLGRFQRLIELFLLTLLMPVWGDDLFTAVVGIEGTMVNHALEAVFLELAALP